MSDQQRQLICSTPKELSEFLNKSKQAVALALPKHLNADRMLRIALTCFSTTPALRDCTAQSILASIVVASQVGLEPGVNGQGYLIPYRDNRAGVSVCTFVPGWQGLVGLLNNSGRATAWTGAVFEGDVWDYQLGSEPHCKHVPGDNFGDPSKLIWVYACGHVNGSQRPVIEAWPIARVWKHRDKFNKVGTRHYSFQHPEMYARKVVLLQVLKYMPRSVELNNAMVAATAAEMNRTTIVQDGTVIDVDATTMPEGGVGGGNGAQEEKPNPPAGQTATEAAAAEKKAPETKPAAEQKGPSLADLRKGVKKAITEKNIGAGRLVQHLVEKEIVKPDTKFDDIDHATMLAISDAIEEHITAILNPA